MRVPLLLLCLLFLLPAWAQEGRVLRVVSAERLELREEGEEEVYVLVGNPVRLEREGERIEARRVVYNRTRRKLYLMEGVRYQDREGRRIEAEELQLDLEDESFDALEVRIEAKGLLLTGPLCQRAAGAILLQRGYATPCAGCGQAVPDYAFRAEEVVLYPGDRVVARKVTLLLQEKPLLELPVLLLFLSERRPRLEVGQDEGGVYFKAALPYAGELGLGFTLLHYYQGRGYGFGFDHFGVGEAKERYFFLHTPPDTFQYRGGYGLKRPEFALSALLERDDTREKLSRFRLEVLLPGTPKPTNWRYALRLEGFLDHDPATPPPRTLKRLPELEVQSPPLQEGPFRLQAGLLLGYYEAETNPLNRSARALGPYAGAGRALFSHSESLTLTPWQGGRFSAENAFRGFYYTTANPDGELERQVDWTTRASFRQALGGFSLEAGYLRSVQEGESPFRFDALPQRRTHQATLGLGFQERPLALVLKGGRDLEKGAYLPLEAEARLQDRGYSLALYHKRVLSGEGPLETRLEGSLTPYPFSLRASLRFDHVRALFDPLLLQGALALAGGSLNLTHRHGLNGEGALTTAFSLNLREGQEAYTLQAQRDWTKNTLALQGQALWGPESLALKLALDPARANYTLTFRSGLTPGPLWEAALLGRIQEGFRDTNLRLSASTFTPEVGFRLQANLHLPEVEDGAVYLKDLTFNGGAELWGPTPPEGEAPGLPGLAFSGGLSYARAPSRPEGYTLALRNFGPTFTFLGRENTKLHLSALLTQDLPGTPLKPKFIVTLDRCCWAFRLTLDAAKGSVSLAFLNGGEAAGVLLSEEGIRLGGTAP